MKQRGVLRFVTLAAAAILISEWGTRQAFCASFAVLPRATLTQGIDSQSGKAAAHQGANKSTRQSELQSAQLRESLLQSLPSGYEVTVLKNLGGIVVVSGEKNLSAVLRARLARLGTLVPSLPYKINAGTSPLGTAASDPDLPLQWHLRNTEGGLDAEVFAGWSFSQKSSAQRVGSSARVTVAVIDTGLALAHPDLGANIFVNQKEIAENGVDDDNNGFIDDLQGWNFSEGTPSPEDDNGHGTHVSGIIAALHNNGIGGAGVSAHARIVPIKAFDASGEAESVTLAKAIDYAVGIGSRVINASWGQYEPDALMEAAVRAAIENGVVFVAAAGNDATNTDLAKHIPSAFGFEGLISVGALDAKSKPAGFSNFGRTTVDVFAPGNAIFSTLLNSTYGRKSGTSMAAPVVAALVADLLALEPTLTPSESKARIMQAASLESRKIEALTGKCQTGGVVSLVSTLGGNPENTYDTKPPQGLAALNAESLGHFEASLRWECATDDIAMGSYLIRRDGVEVARAKGCQWRDSLTEGGQTYSYSVSATDWAGNEAFASQALVTTPVFGQRGAWSAFYLNVESPHPYPPGANLTFEVAVPPEYKSNKIRMHFSKFNTEDVFDKVTVIASDGTFLGQYSGEKGAFTTEEFVGSGAKLILTSDNLNSKFGFALDRLEAYIEDSSPH